jgi:hypothetical protein
MNLTKKIWWFGCWPLLCFALLTTLTASRKAYVDGTDDYGFPFRFSRTGGDFADAITGESHGVDDFNLVYLGLDFLFAIALAFLLRFIWLKLMHRKN